MMYYQQAVFVGQLFQTEIKMSKLPGEKCRRNWKDQVNLAYFIFIKNNYAMPI